MIACDACGELLQPLRSGWLCPSGCSEEDAGRRWRGHPDYTGPTCPICDEPWHQSKDCPEVDEKKEWGKS